MAEFLEGLAWSIPWILFDFCVILGGNSSYKPPQNRLIQQPLSVVILSAGQGKRMRSSGPKVLHHLAGQPLLWHVIDATRQLDDVAQVLVITGHQKEIVENWLDKNAPDATKVEQKEQLGTGHAVLEAMPHVTGARVLVLYGDVPSVPPATLQAFLNDVPGDAVGVLTADYENPKGLGRIIRDASGNVTEIIEEKDADEATKAIQEINTGMILAPSAFLQTVLPKLENQNKQKEYYLTDIIKLAHQHATAVIASKVQKAWCTMGVNDKNQLANLERLMQEEKAKALMAEGVQVMDPKRLDIRGSVQAGPDTLIDVNVIFEGEVTLGANVKVGANSIIKNAVIKNGVTIEPFSHIDGATINENSTIGPFARIRPQTEIGKDCRVGNFVEMKKTTFKDGAKAGHLSYLGDATVGADVNIGAGTVTCNYDGVNKHQTIIDSEAFIGSGTMLVAPVTVGKGATVGAGSTITDDIPNEQLAVARNKQRLVPGWKKPKKEG